MVIDVQTGKIRQSSGSADAEHLCRNHVEYTVGRLHCMSRCCTDRVLLGPLQNSAFDSNSAGERQFVFNKLNSLD